VVAKYKMMNGYLKMISGKKIRGVFYLTSARFKHFSGNWFSIFEI